MREANRASWDARAPLHVGSAAYGLDRLRAGAGPLGHFEWEHLGELTDRDVVHLQCHIGSDTVALARSGAKVSGVDISGVSVDAARHLATQCGLAVEYVRSDVYDAVDAVGGDRFDVVYTGKGALNWLPDPARWARVVAALLRPGGRLCLVEFHPLVFAAADEQSHPRAGLWLDHDYFGGAVVRDDAEQTCTGDTIDGPAETYEWLHGLGDVINALVRAGLRIDALDERDITPWWPWEGLTATQGWWCLPEGAPKLPLTYALRATLPG